MLFTKEFELFPPDLLRLLPLILVASGVPFVALLLTWVSWETILILPCH